jgi:hypothetical protein
MSDRHTELVSGNDNPIHLILPLMFAAALAAAPMAHTQASLSKAFAPNIIGLAPS